VQSGEKVLVKSKVQLWCDFRDVSVSGEVRADVKSPFAVSEKKFSSPKKTKRQKSDCESSKSERENFFSQIVKKIFFFFWGEREEAARDLPLRTGV
jgi:hypothetical protein